jgi:hypothetical protein
MIRETRFAGAMAALLLACGVGTAANAALLYNNGSDLGISGMFSERDPLMDPSDGQTRLIQAGDRFRLTEDATLGFVRWWGSNSPSASDTVNSFQISLYEFSGGAPSESPFYSDQPASVARSSLSAFSSLFEYSASIDPILLSANTDYMLEIVNDFGTPNDLSDYWVWIRSVDGPDGLHSARQSLTATPGSWSTDAFVNDLAFQLYTPVPIPAAAWLFGGALIGLSSIGWRRR